MPKEANELLEIWLEFYDLNKDYVLRENRSRQRFGRTYLYKYDGYKVLRFWHLKDKIDAMKRQIIDAFAQIEKLYPMKKSK